MRPIEAEARALEIMNAVDGLLASLPASSPPAARKALTDARSALQRAAYAFADDTEAGHRLSVADTPCFPYGFRTENEKSR